MRTAFVPTTPTLCPTLLCAAALSACGGGGSDDPTAATATGVEAATAYAANATLVAGDATDALDTGVQAAQAVVLAQATTASIDSRATALSSASAIASAEFATPLAVANVAVACPGGGNATLTITGATPTGLLNGKLDTGEVYQIVFAACRGAAGAAAVTGALTMTVQSATAADLSLTLASDGLTVALPRGSVTVVGSTSFTRNSVTDGSGATRLTSQTSSPSLTLSTQFNARQSSFTLSALSITRQSTWLNGVVQSSSMSGTHTLAATLPNGAFSYAVSTQGGVSYAANGLPTAGAWAITLPRTLVTVSVANALATISIDDGKDGTIDRSFTIPVGNLQSAAG